MCGIAGIVSKRDHLLDRLLKVERVQAHRGPDSAASLEAVVGQFQVGLAHQRLSIIDLSEAGNQPMAEADGRSWIVYNGEIYNYIEIKAQLEALGWQFRTNTDTEVILAALRVWGLEDSFRRFNGMWAFAWLDLANQRLVICRDRVGVKPIYLYQGQGEFLFSSEIKGVLAMAENCFGLNAKVISEFLDQSLLDTTNETFFAGITKLPAGHYGVIDLSSTGLLLKVHSYWRIPEEVAEDRSELDWIEQFRTVFLDAVRLRLRSDVPLGILLSGGLDSSSIAAAMQTLASPNSPMHLISAVSNDPHFDESPFIDTMAKHLNCPVAKVSIEFQPNEAFDLLEKACWHNDEPLGSFSNVAHYLLMKEAKRLGITVVLSGQGADELFCGYKKYLGFYVHQLLRDGRIGKALALLASFHQQGTVLNQFSFGEAKRYLPALMDLGAPSDIRGPALQGFKRVPIFMQDCKTVNQRQILDVERFSIPIITHYEDRMSMAWSREIRVPFLDYRLVELLISLPIHHKLAKGWTKYILRKAMEPMLPPSITWRRDKQGFVLPQSEWLKNELHDKSREYFRQDSLMALHGLVDIQVLNNKYSRYCRQSQTQRGISYKDIFNPLSLEIWLRQFQSHISA